MAGRPWVSARVTAPTGFEPPMIRWMLVIFLALIFISWLSPLLQKLGLGRLPGDFRFRVFGREWYIPLATTLLLSFAVSMIAHLI